MQHPYSSSPGSLSSPPSALEEPGSPTRFLNAGRANIEMDEIVVDPGSVGARFGVIPQQPAPAQPTVQLTAAGLPRKKPGRKPGSTVKPKVATDGSSTNEAPKQRRPRKPRDPNAPPIQRKRKAAPTEDVDKPDLMDVDQKSFASAVAPRQTKITELTSMRQSMERPPPPPPVPSNEPPYAQKMPKREPFPGSMQSILNRDPSPPLQHQYAPPPPNAAAAVSSTTTSASSRPVFDPVRGNYDPVRETMLARDPYGTGPLGSPRAPTQVPNRASASPSIASLVDPAPPSMISPVPTTTGYNNAAAQPRFQESGSLPPSPSHPVQTASTPQPLAKPAITEIRRPPPPPPTLSATKSETTRAKPDVPKPAGFTSTSTVPSSLAATLAAAAPVQSKKVAAVVQQERETQKKKASSSTSSPKVSGLRDALPPVPSVPDRSILDFGKANPGEETSAPNIVLHIPLNGEINKYVNFMRVAEERYGWDALNPRLAANRDRKARIAAATAALEKNGSGRESGDEMDEDIQSDAENSNVEMGGMGNGAPASGPDAVPAKPARKKRNFKEDEYDKDDDFVDDSEMLWEEQAAASRDGFFVYSGPLVPEVEKPAIPDGPPKRGRGGRGSRGGGRGGTTRGEGTGRGRGGGPGSRGGSVTRKPRITKLEKEQRDREKAEREKLAQLASKAGPNSGYNLLQLSPAPAPSATAGAS